MFRKFYGGIARVTKSRDSTLAFVLCSLVCATIVMFTSQAGAFIYTYSDALFTGSFQVSGTDVDPATGLKNPLAAGINQAYTLVGAWDPWSHTSALTVDSYSFTGQGYTFSMATDHPAPNSVVIQVNHAGQIVDWSWTIYDGAPWPDNTVAYLVLYGGPEYVGNSNPRPDQENLYILKPSYDPLRYTNTGTWSGSPDAPVRSLLLSGFQNYYNSVLDAYNATASGSSVSWLLKQQDFPESLDIDKDINITLKGGYDSTFVTNSGNYSTLQGITVSAGSLIVENVVL